MNTIYLGGVVVIAVLFYYRCKKNSDNKKQIMPVTTKEIKLETSKVIYHEISKEIIPETPTKNKWLYPTDEFGKMEKGVVSESVTYVY